LRFVYDEDVEKYKGHPEDALILTGDPVTTSDPTWLQHLDKEAKKITRAVKKQGKRKRPAVEVDPEEQAEPVSGPQEDAGRNGGDEGGDDNEEGGAGRDLDE
jgi:hypothetical protein